MKGDWQLAFETGFAGVGLPMQTPAETPSGGKPVGTLYFVLGPQCSSAGRIGSWIAEKLTPSDPTKEERELREDRKFLTSLIEHDGSNPSSLERLVSAIIPKADYRFEGANIGISTNKGVIVPNIAIPLEGITSPKGVEVGLMLERSNLEVVAAILGKSLKREWVRADVTLR